ncbi:tetratricopeptide-like helical domain-containing protein [Tanacetum coccineum]
MISRRHSILSKCTRSSSFLDVVEDEEICSLGGGGGDGDGKMCGGYGGGKGGGESDDDHGTDLYYKTMIDANPGNSLLLGNYAKYLKEVRGDLVKAEEFCSRAILTNPSDGNALSMYADLIWVTQKDSSRAETYFDQAVKASRLDGCYTCHLSYVMASYARFLWDADEEDEEEVSSVNVSPPSFLHEASQQFPVAAT